MTFLFGSNNADISQLQEQYERLWALITTKRDELRALEKQYHELWTRHWLLTRDQWPKKPKGPAKNADAD